MSLKCTAIGDDVNFTRSCKESQQSSLFTAQLLYLHSKIVVVVVAKVTVLSEDEVVVAGKLSKFGGKIRKLRKFEIVECIEI